MQVVLNSFYFLTFPLHSLIREYKWLLFRTVCGKKVEDDVWLNVFIQLMIFISPLTSYLLFFLRWCVTTLILNSYSCLPLLRNTVTLPSWDFHSALKYCSRIKLDICSPRHNFHERGWTLSLCDVHRQCCTGFWMEYLGVVDRIPNILEKKKGRIIQNNKMHCK